MKTSAIFSFAVILFLVGFSWSHFPQADPYSPIPTGFDFPGDQTALEQLRTSSKVAEQRKHVWMVWAGLNQNAPHGGPIWETWYRDDEVFSLSGPLEGAERPIRRKFVKPRQLKELETAGQSQFSGVLFDKPAKDHIRTNKFYLQATLNNLNAGFPVGTPLPARKIADFPHDSVVLKLVWMPVKQTGLTIQPIWDLTPSQPIAQSNGPNTWKRQIAIDPSRADIPADEMNSGNHVVPLKRFYSVKIDTAEVATATGMQIGDFMVLVGMHVTTKEIPDWVWATFWWHDRPNDGPFALDRVSQVSGVWQNYLMNISYDTNEPKEYDGSPHACMNPWLEARFPNGLGSNCMTCHQRSTWPQAPANPVPFLPVTRGGLNANDPFYQDRTKLDFLWSIGDLAQ